MKQYEERIAIYNITGGSDAELYEKSDIEDDIAGFNSADETWLPVRKLEKKIGKTNLKYEKEV